MEVSVMIAAQELQAIRRFVRKGDVPRQWPISRRRIYDEDVTFSEETENYQILHEFTFLVTDDCEVFAVICFFAEEFSINLGGPSIDGYMNWLLANDGKSPLYPVGAGKIGTFLK